MSDWQYGFTSLDVVKPKYQEITIDEVDSITHEPVDLEEMKNYLKIDYATDDDLIESLIKSARKQIESELGGLLTVKRQVTQRCTGGLERIELLRQPVNSITSITYNENFDSTGTTITDYRRVKNILYHKDGFFKTGREADGYVIVYNAGLVDDSGQSHIDVPRAIRTAIERIVSYLYENREQFATNYSEGNWSINYDTGIRNEINALISTYSTGKGVF